VTNSGINTTLRTSPTTGISKSASPTPCPCPCPCLYLCGNLKKEWSAGDNKLWSPLHVIFNVKRERNQNLRLHRIFGGKQLRNIETIDSGTLKIKQVYQKRIVQGTANVHIQVLKRQLYCRCVSFYCCKSGQNTLNSNSYLRSFVEGVSQFCVFGT
jgi:hypothetical protein